MWIVVVDDHPDSLEVICACLQWIGHECIGVATCDEALRAVERRWPDIIMLDLGLPAIDDGLDVARTIRRTQEAPSFLVAMTGWSDALARSNEAEFDARLLKPFGLAQLRELCGRCQRTDPSRDAPAASPA